MALAMVEAVWGNPDAAMWLKAEGTRFEVTVCGVIEGVFCKGRLDVLHPRAILDLKTTNNGAPIPFGNFAWKNGYLFKQAIHRELVRQMVGETLPVYYIPVENKPPHDCSVQEIVKEDEQILDQELEKAKKILRKYKQCLDSDNWPGVDEGKGTMRFYVPTYAMEADSISGCDVVDFDGE